MRHRLYLSFSGLRVSGGLDHGDRVPVVAVREQGELRYVHGSLTLVRDARDSVGQVPGLAGDPSAVLSEVSLLIRTGREDGSLMPWTLLQCLDF